MIWASPLFSTLISVNFSFGQHLKSESVSCSVISNSYCDPMDCSPPGSSVHGILQARILEWAYISFSRGSSWPKDWTQLSCLASKFFTIWVTREALATSEVCVNTHPANKDVQIRCNELGTSLVVQWLRPRLPIQGVEIWSLVRELRSHLPWSQKTKM